jgi:hypothetical protein
VRLGTTPIETNNQYGLFWWLETLSGARPSRGLAVKKSRILVRQGSHEYLLRWRPLGSAAGPR